MIRNFLVIALLMSFGFAGSAHAESGRTTRTNTGTPSAATLACVGSAVATREAALITAIDAHGTTVKSAYTTRKTTLATLYAGGYTNAQMREKIRGAWNEFRGDIRDAKTTWKTASRSAWNTYRDAVKECRASEDLTDKDNSSMESKGE